MNRIEERMNCLKEKEEKAFITYMTAGLPDMEACKQVIYAQERAGTDILELGIPFSDPVADGPVIQEASYKAILQGVTLSNVFQMVEEVRQGGCQIPIVFMMYYNTMLYYGLEAFVEECVRVGVDGIIIPDLPFEEQGEINVYLKKENAPILIQLVSPVSKDRVPMILEDARGFVYCVSSMGVTGQEGGFHKDIIAYLKYVKEVSKIPIMMGFGIKHACDVKEVRNIIDGAIVGSYFIRLMEESNYKIEKIEQYIKEFKMEL